MPVNTWTADLKKESRQKADTKNDATAREKLNFLILLRNITKSGQIPLRGAQAGCWVHCLENNTRFDPSLASWVLCGKEYAPGLQLMNSYTVIGIHLRVSCDFIINSQIFSKKSFTIYMVYTCNPLIIKCNFRLDHGIRFVHYQTNHHTMSSLVQ